jgi:hypothetical protein
MAMRQTPVAFALLMLIPSLSPRCGFAHIRTILKGKLPLLRGFQKGQRFIVGLCGDPSAKHGEFEGVINQPCCFWDFCDLDAERAEIWEGGSSFIAGLKMLFGGDPKQIIRIRLPRGTCVCRFRGTYSTRGVRAAPTKMAI